MTPRPQVRSAEASPEAQAQLFAALGDATRLQLLRQLSREGPGSIARLGTDATVSRQAVRKHLQVLADAGLVIGERQGREHIWRLEPARLGEAQDHLARIGQHWDDALARLKRFVET